MRHSPSLFATTWTSAIVFALLFLAYNASPSKAFVSTVPMVRSEVVVRDDNDSFSGITRIAKESLVVLAAKKGKKTTKNKKRSSPGGGFGAVGSKKPPKQQEDTGAVVAETTNNQQQKKKRATASHILIKDGNPKAEAMLRDIKTEVGNDPSKFAHYASQYSECGSRTSGGSLGEFGMGQMAKEFEDVVFNEEVGRVHGPVRTQFGYHLIYVSERSDPNNKMENYFNSRL